MDTQVLERHLKSMPQVWFQKNYARKFYQLRHVRGCRLQSIHIRLCDLHIRLCDGLWKGSSVMTMRLQKVVVLSTTEAKYMPAVEDRKELIWIKNFLSELGTRKIPTL